MSSQVQNTLCEVIISVLSCPLLAMHTEGIGGAGGQLGTGGLGGAGGQLGAGGLGGTGGQFGTGGLGGGGGYSAAAKAAKYGMRPFNWIKSDLFFFA